MINKHISLYDFGYNFLGPICSEYFFALKKKCEALQADRLLFLAREGYFFSKAYKRLVDQKLLPSLPSTYLYASRTFLFKINLGESSSWDLSLSHGFYGTLEKLLVNRFGLNSSQVGKVFSKSELGVKWFLPLEQDLLTNLFKVKQVQLKDLVKDSRMAYLDYLAEEQVTDSQCPLMIDVGYSGTIQKLMTRILKSDTQGLYFIATKEGEHPIGQHLAIMSSVFKHGVKMGDGYTMLDRSLFLESLLTSPDGQFIDIKKTTDFSQSSFKMYFGRKTYVQQNIQELETLFEGAIKAICHYMQHNIRFSKQEIEDMYEQFTYNRALLPESAWPLFDVDDAISGNSNVNPLSLFRL